MGERKLAKVVEIDEVKSHSNADALELAVIGGWQCCVKKGEFQKGDKAVYFEIDSMLPIHNPTFAFLEARGTKEVDGVKYSRIKTIKLRGELSQGLLIPVSQLGLGKSKTDTDVTEKLGIIKYEAPEEKQSNGGNVAKTRSNWPSFLPKTDQERVQNLTKQYEEAVKTGEVFEATVKLDGSSFTSFVVNENGKPRVGLCSRNLELYTKDVHYSFFEQLTMWSKSFFGYNKKFLKYWKINFPKWEKGFTVSSSNFLSTFNKYSLEDVLIKYHAKTGNQIALQGEMVGPGIQGNFEGLDEVELYIYDIYSIDYKRYFLPEERLNILQELNYFLIDNSVELKSVPIFWYGDILPATVQECLELADGASGLKGKYREGLVFKSWDRDFSFKAISNRYLLKSE